MKIGFITTIDTNIGDDFIRQGIEHIIDSVKGNIKIEYTYVNKHLPESSIHKNSPVHFVNRLPFLKVKSLLMKVYNKFFYHLYSILRNQDLIVQSGAPVLWPDCYKNEWAEPIWYNTIGKLKDKIPVIDLAAGSCYPWERQNGFTNKEEARYAKDIGSFCKLTTTRDKLASQLFSSVGIANKLFPCTAFFVHEEFENKSEGEYILINYMEGGGHFDWDQHISKDYWEKIILTVTEKLKTKYDVRFICHNDKEVVLAERIAPGCKIHYPKTIREYLSVIKKAKLGINNRMHASVAMCSVGVPNISVGTDTRLLMLETLGSPFFYVKDINDKILLEQANKLMESFVQERDRLFTLKRKTFNEYRKIISPFFQTERMG